MSPKRVKIFGHIMPWDLDYYLLMADKFAKSIKLIESGIYFNRNEFEFDFDFTLNLSSYIIDWEKSRLPKSFFENKFFNINNILKNVATYYHFDINYGHKIFGHLDTQKTVVNSNVDYYLGVCPDISFDENLLGLMLYGTKSIENDNFVLTPEMPKLWDHTWDELTNEKFKNVGYINWGDQDVYDVFGVNQQLNGTLNIEPARNNKWAGWFDLYSKKFYEQIVPVHPNWYGYGPWDWYGMLLMDSVGREVGFQQYILRGSIISDYSKMRPLGIGGLHSCYKNSLSFNPRTDERKEFENNMHKYLVIGKEMLRKKGLIE